MSRVVGTSLTYRESDFSSVTVSIIVWDCLESSFIIIYLASVIITGQLANVVYEQRDIPTCVGKTIYVCSYKSVLWEHPHIRGEDGGRIEAVKVISGTSPHTWGRY